MLWAKQEKLGSDITCIAAKAAAECWRSDD